MTPQELAKFLKEAKERGEAAAKAWHSGLRIRPSTKSENASTIGKIKAKQEK